MLKKVAAALIAFVIAGGIFSGTAYGLTFQDVPEGHWAYNSIDKVTNLGLMTGQTVDRFGINEMINKFEMSRILATLAGYKSFGATFEEHTYYEQLYQKHIGTIQQISQHLARWRSEYDTEIAYLLELGILTPLDLQHFIVIQSDSEGILALRRDEFCVFLVRLLDAEDVARSFVPSSLFSDDHDIEIPIKPYIYYMRHIGMITGDAHGNFNPRNALSKAAMAVLLDKTINLLGFGGNQQEQQPGTQQPGGNYSTMIGEITHVHSSFRAIEVRNLFNGERTIFPVLNNASIVVDGDPAFFDRLETKMDVAAVLLSGDVLELVAISHSKDTPSGGGNNIPNIPNIPIDPGAVTETVIEGIVIGTKIINGLEYIDVEVRIINTLGEIIEEQRTFLLDDYCEISRGSNPIGYLQINPGDIATLTIAGSTVFDIHLEDKYRNIIGTVTGKRAVEATGAGILTVKDNMGRTHELVTTERTSITRTDHIGLPSWNDIRIGDHVEITAEFSQIISVGARGTRSMVDVVITKLTVSAAYAELTGVALTGAGTGREITYPVIPLSGVDLFDYQIGSMVRLGLDSQEIDNVLLLHDEHTETLTGFLRSIRSDRIYMQNALDSNEYRAFYFDSDMTIVDSTNGARVNSTGLRQDMSLYLVYAHDSRRDVNYITHITILQH